MFLLTESQAANFLNAMARDIDFSKIERSVPEKGPHGGLPTPFKYNPMKRKAYRMDGEQKPANGK
jgi:hypothetical protein